MAQGKKYLHRYLPLSTQLAGLVFCVTLALQWGCGDKDKAQQSSIPQTPIVAKPKPVEEAKKPTEPEPEKAVYAYNPVGKRDPFEKYRFEDKSIEGVPKTPLQDIDISQMKLVGIIWGISNPRAMVEVPGGKGYVIKKGTLIGRNWGKVTRIKPDEVIIAEEFRDIDGKLVVNEISMKLPKPKGLDELEMGL